MQEARSWTLGPALGTELEGEAGGWPVEGGLPFSLYLSLILKGLTDKPGQERDVFCVAVFPGFLIVIHNQVFFDWVPSLVLIYTFTPFCVSSSDNSG